MDNSPSDVRPRIRAPWVVGPVFDLLFVAGGMPILLIAANVMKSGWTLPESTADSGSISALLLGVVLVGQHLFANSHNIATYLRIWGSDEDRHRFAFHRTWLVALFIPLFVWGLYSPHVTGIFVYVFLMAVFWHYAAQSYGVALIYCYKRDYRLSLFEKRAMKACMTTISAFAILRILSFREYSPYEWYGVAMPFWGPFPPIFFRMAKLAFSISLLLFSAGIVIRIVRTRQLFPLPSLMVLGAVIALGLSKSSTHAMLWFYIPPFFHGTQYLAICLAYALKERGEVDSVSLRTLFGSRLAQKLFLTTVVVGALLYVVIPHVFSRLGFSYAMVAGLVLAVVNFHHFITDAAIWKLRDPRCRELLLA
ncbi:MAG: hypothetical protein U0136_21405 [Bdellovibrionota bacterium]